MTSTTGINTAGGLRRQSTTRYFYCNDTRPVADEALLRKEYERLRRLVRDGVWPVVERAHVVQLGGAALFCARLESPKASAGKQLPKPWRSALSRDELRSLKSDVVTVADELMQVKEKENNRTENEEGQEKEKEKEMEKDQEMDSPRKHHMWSLQQQQWRFIQLASTMRTSGIRLYPAKLLPRVFVSRSPAKAPDEFVAPPGRGAAGASAMAEKLQEIAERKKKVLLGILPDCSVAIVDEKRTQLLLAWRLTHVQGFGTKKAGGDLAFILQVHGIKSPLVFACAAKKVFEQVTALTRHLKQKATSEKSSLSGRLEVLGFETRDVEGDGNCQFRAVADQLFKDQERHKHVREQAVAWLAANAGGPPAPAMSAEFALSNFLDTDAFPTWAALVKYHSKDKSWGDHLTLVAMANHFKVFIVVHSSLSDAPELLIEPAIVPKKCKTIYLYHWHGVHYGSLVKVDKEKKKQSKSIR